MDEVRVLEGGASVHHLSLYLWLIPSGCLFLEKWNKMEESELFTLCMMHLFFFDFYILCT